MITVGHLYRLATRLLPLVPPRLGYQICDQLALVGPLTPAWSAINANLRQVVPQASARERHALARRTVGHLLKNYYDLLRAHQLSSAELAASFEIEGLANGMQALATERGIIVCTLHTGNFSLAFEPVARAFGIELAVVVEQMQDPTTHSILNTLRQRSGVRIMPLHASITRELLRILQRGGVIVLAQDRLVGSGSLTVDFFGKPVALPAGPATLAQRTNALILPVYATRTRCNRNRVVIDPPLLPAPANQPNSLQRTTQALVRIMEAYIRPDPSQWLLTNRVWGE